MSHWLSRSAAALVMSAASLIAISAAPAQASPHASEASIQSVRGAAEDVACGITGSATVSHLLLITTVDVKVVCHTTAMAAVTVKVGDIALARTDVLLVADVEAQVKLLVPGLLPLEAEVCVETDGDEACATVKL
ncbi:hypothetical protein ABIE67_009204 [Streptomyces sp. V4I8]|uniref:hypothetical protein n=1 Tax=Streptomyces sp. V4I8 TaxID=3156469 RepID=UPI00351561A1